MNRARACMAGARDWFFNRRGVGLHVSNFRNLPSVSRRMIMMLTSPFSTESRLKAVYGKIIEKYRRPCSCDHLESQLFLADYYMYRILY